MKPSYFPYLPSSKNEDNKRYKYMLNKIEKEPFIFHKKKNASFVFKKHYYISQNNNLDLNKNQNKVNQELLFFQNDNDRYINSYNNFMKNKSDLIKENAFNYLHYISQKNKLSNTDITNSFEPKINFLNNSQLLNQPKKILTKNKSLPNIKIPFRNLKKEEFKLKLAETDKNNNINFVPRIIKARGSDITNPFFYDQVARDIMQKNYEVMNYNLKESENKFFLKKKIPKYSDEKIALAPGKINNPNYYNLGESKLEKNPILNKGIYSPSFSYNANYFKRYKGIFDN